MLIVITLTSILSLTILVWLAKRILPFQVCPICAGVSGTWVWLMAAHFWGYQIDLTIPALLMGGTVVGAMSKLEKFVAPKFVLVWKTIFVMSGFLAADSLITGHWLIFTVGIIVAVIITLAFKWRGITGNKLGSERIAELKKKMKSCC
jgi:hypothetical protein